MSALPPELARRIADAKTRANLVEIVGRKVKLRKAGREFTGLCPFHDEKTASFAVVPEKGFYHCFGCGAHGDAIKFLMEQEGHDFRGALEAIEARTGGGAASPPRNAPAAKRESQRTERDDGFVSSTEAGIAVWREGQRARGELVERYLRGRGIDPDTSGILSVVRFHPACPVSKWRRWEKPGDARLTAEAMLAPICVLDGRAWVQVGVHITFLAPDGNGKAKLPPWQDRGGEWHKRPSRKIWGEAGLGCVPIPPAEWQARWQHAGWLDQPGELVVAEGLESTLSLRARVARARGALATLSLNNLQGHWLEDDWRAPGSSCGHSYMPLWNLQADPERPGFTVPDAGAVTIGIDADMAGLKNRWVQERPKAAPVRRDLTGAERSAICAQISAAHWRLAGARPVRVLRPAMGRDFNNVAMEEQGHE